MTTTTTTTSLDTRGALWKGMFLTAAAALFFPRLNAVLYDHEKLWELDPEARVLAPVLVLVAVGIFLAVGPWAWRGLDNRPARVGLVVALLSVVGVLAFWMSMPIVLGGLAVTLGLEGLRRDDEGHRTRAQVAVVLGALTALGGALLWVVGV